MNSQDFSFTRSDEWALRDRFPDAWKELADSWNRLVPDHYMKQGDAYRRRRFCKYDVDAASMAFEELDDFVFFQSSSINAYAGGMSREFAPVEPDIRRNRIVREIVSTCLQAIALTQRNPPENWKVFVHQIRIDCSSVEIGQPTPEGLHRDGHDFISMHLVDRVGVQGGASRICSRDDRPLLQVTLEKPMDGFLVDDRRLLHGVSQITPSTSAPGHRDMLIIDYNRDE